MMTNATIYYPACTGIMIHGLAYRVLLLAFAMLTNLVKNISIKFKLMYQMLQSRDKLTGFD